ncbi:MAG TPA: MFS transporter [Ktedonobacterales bacterium]|nr:MFS transporter [Ktedonobacterales bacterium]
MTAPSRTAGQIAARLDRITVWALPLSYLFIIGLGFLFTFYDIFDINVSFIQTCTQIVPKCLAGPPPGATSLPPGFVEASEMLGLPVLWNLIGYVIGALSLGPLADRFGRRDMLLVTLVVTGLGSLATAFVNDYNTFIIARTITGIGIGADLAIVNTYINEVAPQGGRAKYTSFIFVSSALGAFVGIWLGLILTTPPAPFPLGLPFAQVTIGEGGVFQGNGWQIMYIVGAALALIGILLRVQLPESPRWLAARGRIEEADAVVSDMERRASRSQTLAPVGADVPMPTREPRAGYVEILTNPVYLRRVLLVLAVWSFAYVTVYTIAAGFTTVLSSLGYIPPEAGLIAAIGTLGFIACAVVAYFFSERLERKTWLPIGAVITLVGGVLIALAGHAASPTAIPWVAFIGAVILFFGFNIWVPMTYTWSTENFPTRARTTGYALSDGIGHVGGGIGLVLIVPLLGQLGPLPAFLLIAAFLVVAAILVQFGVSTRKETLEQIAP